MQAGYYRQPTIHKDRIVFVCEDDLWSVPAGGGTARRLTAGTGIVAFPCFSPDGKRLAYTGRDDGPPEVYVMDADGGPGTRRTWLGDMLRTTGWSADGERVRFASNSGRPFRGEHHLYEVAAGGAPPERLPFGPARELAEQPRGKGRVLGINSGDPARWKRYRGGTAGVLWIDRGGTGEFERLLDLPGNLAGPMWIGGRIYFLSDHQGHGNLYSCTPTGRGVRRHTHHQDYYVRFPATDGRRIVYHAGADLYVYDPKTDRAARVPITLASARPARARRFVAPAAGLESVALHPQGHTLACTIRGGLHTLPLWAGAPLRLGQVSDARYRCPRWLPGGKRIALVTDETGEEQLQFLPAAGSGRTKRIHGDFGRAVDLAVAPAGGDRIAIANHRHELWFYDGKTGRRRRLAHSPAHRIRGMAWSPDGRWLCYAMSPTHAATCLHLFDVRRGRTHRITRPDFHDYAPSFDPDGKYLYFLSGRAFDPVYDQHYFDLGFPYGVTPCLIPLAKTTPDPFRMAQRPLKGPGADEDESEGKDKKKSKKPAPVKIDLVGIEDRIVTLPVEESRFERVVGGKGRVFFTDLPAMGSLNQQADDQAPPALATLRVYDFEQDKVLTYKNTVSDFDLTPDGKTLLIRAGNDVRVVAAAADPKDMSTDEVYSRASGWVDLERVRVAVEPAREWRQMFREAWRLQRDHFWTEDMSKVDWKTVHDRYLPLVDRVASRLEFSDLMWELQGELGTSHCYELGGDYARGRTWHQGLLGADVAYGGRPKRWRITYIPRGDSWRPAAASPLAAPGLDVRVGDEIVSVAGQNVGADRSPAACLVNRAGLPVVLVLRRGNGKARTIAVETLVDERELRYRDWVETNRARVHAATKGRVGYLHVPDMGPRGFSEFHRYYRGEVEREGLIIDVRWNGGGHVSQLLLEKLARRRIGYDATRYNGVEPYPLQAPFGPMVALTNEYAGSDGDMFSHAWKLYGLGPLIGKRTWGGVVGIWPRHALVDGTVTTQPEFAFWFEDVGYGVENHGTDPDIEVAIRPQDHAAGKDTQLDRALTEIRRLLKENPPRLPDLKKGQPNLRPPRLPRP